MNTGTVWMRWHRRLPRFRTRPWPLPRLRPGLRTAVVVLVVATCAAGCEVRDEAVRPDASPGRWPLAALDSAARLDDARAGAVPKPGIEYVEGYEAAARRAATGRMPIMLVFRAAWCRWSGEIAQGPLADPGLVALSRRFACATVDADRDAETCRAFSVTGFPTVLVLDADGRERFRATGAAAAGGLPAAMSDVVAGLDRPQRLAAGPEGTPTRESKTGADDDTVR